MRFRLAEDIDYNKIIDELASYNFTIKMIREDRSNVTKDSNLVREFKARGRMDLRGTQLSSPSDIVFLSRLFRDNRFETFRILYIKDNKIISHECITAKTPGSTQTYKKPTLTPEDEQNEYDYYNKQLRRHNADGYFLCHNHPGGDSSPSGVDRETSKKYKDNVLGFKGHIIVGINDICFVDKNLNNHFFKIDDINVFKKDYKLTDDLGWLDPEAIEELICDKTNKKDYTSVMYLNAGGSVVEFLEIKNTEFNDKNIFKWLNRYKQNIGACHCYIGTFSSQIELASEWAVFHRLIDNCYLIGGNETITAKTMSNISIDDADRIRFKFDTDNEIYDALGKLKDKETIIHG